MTIESNTFTNASEEMTAKTVAEHISFCVTASNQYVLLQYRDVT